MGEGGGAALRNAVLASFTDVPALLIDYYSMLLSIYETVLEFILCYFITKKWAKFVIVGEVHLGGPDIDECKSYNIPEGPTSLNCS